MVYALYTPHSRETPMRLTLPLLLGFAACGPPVSRPELLPDSVIPPCRSCDSAPDTSAVLHVTLGARAPGDTTRKVDTIPGTAGTRLVRTREIRKVIARIDTVYRRDTVVIRVDTLPAPLPDVVARRPLVGVWSFPVESLGAGYTGTVITVNTSTLLATLETAKRKGGGLALYLSRNKSIDNGKLSVAAAKGELGRWPDLAPYLDTVVKAVIIGDDVAGGDIWGLTTAQVLPLFDQIACAVKVRWPKAVTTLRALPTQLTSYDWSRTKCLDFAWAQYTNGWHRHGPVRQWRDLQLMTAQGLGLKVAFGLNSLDGGQVLSVSPGRCASGILGTFAPGTSFACQMGASEIRAYGDSTIGYSCLGLVNWTWGPGWDYSGRPSSQVAGIKVHDRRPDVKQAYAHLRAVADTLPRGTCARS